MVWCWRHSFPIIHSFKAMDIYTGQTVAMKKVKIEDSSDGIPSTSLREISVLRSLDHPNIVK